MEREKQKYTILYARLSEEDARQGKSLSIEHQEKMLRDRATEENLSNVLFLFDDGITGVKTDRENFTKVMSMISNGEVSTLIVTDLGRLYRNQDRANHLMEILFPSLGVRFISILEHYDTKTNTPSDEDMAMFTNFFNEFYPRQTSRKINAVNAMKAKNGVRLASIPPFGYQKDPDDNLKIIPDPEAAKIVLRIFELCASGFGPQQIANLLKKEKVLVPAEYAFRVFGREHATRNPNHPYDWSSGTVARILENEDYIGNQISCKTHKISYKSDLVLSVPDEEQVRIDGAHEPIIPKELWDIVQEIRAHKRRPTKMGEMDMLSGLVCCADCGHTHHLCRCGKWEESKYTYVCGTYHGHKDECTPHTIKAVHLKMLVLHAIQAVCASTKKDREAFLARLLSKQSKEAKKKIAEKRKDLEQAKHRLGELDGYIATSFEKLASGILTDEQFMLLGDRYNKEKEELESSIPVMERELDEAEKNVDSAYQFLAIVDRYTDIQELTPEIVHEFIHCIVVHERSERWKKKNYTQDVDIYFNYIGKLN